MKKLVALFTYFLSLHVAAQNVGIGTTMPAQRLDVAGSAHVRDSLGIGISTPAAPLQFANTIRNRKLVLYDDDGGQHRFYGFGISLSELRYQSTANHVFYSATSPTASRENFRINANGRVGIGNSSPSYTLDVNGNSRVAGDFIHTSADGGGTWVYLTNTNAFPTGWKLVTTPSPSAGSGGDLLFYNANNTPALTVRQNTTVAASGNLNVGGNLTAAGITSLGNLTVDGGVSAGGNISAGGKFNIGLEYKVVESSIAGLGLEEISCLCPNGKKVIGGGGGHRDFNDAARDVIVDFSGPMTNGSGWRTTMHNNAPSGRTVQVWAICANVQ